MKSRLAKLRLKPMKIERLIFHRRAAKTTEMIDLFFFAAETPAKKNAHALPSGLEALRPGSGAGSVTYQESARSVRSFPFLSSQQKREKTTSSAISASRVPGGICGDGR